MTVPTRFHLELDRLLADLPGPGAPSGSTTVGADGRPCVSLSYDADVYAERVSADTASLNTIAGWTVRASWMPHSASALTHTVCHAYSPSSPVAAAPKTAARKSR